MRIFLFLSLVILALTGCKELHDDTVVNGRIVDAVTGDPVPNEKVWLVESTSAISPEGGKFDYMESAITDQNGKFTFTFEARPWDKFKYFGIMDAYLNSEKYVADTEGLRYTTSDLTKFQTNTVELKVCPKAYLNMMVSNEINPSVSDSLYVIFENRAIAWKSEMGPRVGLNPSGPPLGRQLYHLPHGLLHIETITIKNGVRTVKKDSLNLPAGISTEYDILY